MKQFNTIEGGMDDIRSPSPTEGRGEAVLDVMHLC